MRAPKPIVASRINKATHTRVDTIQVTPSDVKAWQNPPFQRPLRVNAKVLALAEELKADGGVFPGVITIGILEKVQYILDGQHRREAFLISGLSEGFCDVRYRTFENMADMGEEFVNLNTSLVRLRPDDILRGLEGHSAALQAIRTRCAFAGYDNIRRGTRAPIIGMSVLLRCWFSSAPETPQGSSPPAAQIARSFTVDEANKCADFLLLAEKAWGRDPEYQRLYGTLNMTLCMWLYRRLVLEPFSTHTQRLTKEQFRACLMALSADHLYLDYLVGRHLSERDRSPCYNKIKQIFISRLRAETGRKLRLPAPPWVTSSIKTSRLRAEA